jgi:hypothetical protein
MLSTIDKGVPTIKTAITIAIVLPIDLESTKIIPKKETTC